MENRFQWNHLQRLLDSASENPRIQTTPDSSSASIYSDNGDHDSNLHSMAGKLLSEETMESIIEESEMDEPPPSNQLEVHIDDILEILDTLLSENRIDEAIAILETEEENFKRVEVELGDVPSDVLMLYKSLISERKAMLTLESTLVAENSRISGPELQKAPVGICRLGESHLANQLLLRYYHSRIARGIHDLQNSKVFLHGVYIREVSRFVFSMISRAAGSFMKLYGETSPFSSEFIQWVYEEIEVFAVSFARYVISVPEVSNRLSTAVESVQFALSYCSLLESQRLVLRPCLIEHVRPCMEDVLLIHVDHFKKVIGIFTATDAWVLGRYLLSGILNESCSSMVIGERPEYCLLTSSGRKFVTVLQDENSFERQQLEEEEPVQGVQEKLNWGSSATEKNL
ncbi:hypothetical protein POTOM_047389 [Populus tomentosa]|uniref:Exocyst component Exo84 C-terminal domain-containing protein n=1 Tax=Populus tomentosa TaxID=118781 RepID=A0A8X7YHP2_POPTO|nr:hypothetical protein POTOM_047389 [Populus tomentosa]